MREKENRAFLVDCKMKVTQIDIAESETSPRISVKFSFNGHEMLHEYSGDYATEILQACQLSVFTHNELLRIDYLAKCRNDDKTTESIIGKLERLL